MNLKDMIYDIRKSPIGKSPMVSNMKEGAILHVISVAIEDFIRTNYINKKFDPIMPLIKKNTLSYSGGFYNTEALSVFIYLNGKIKVSNNSTSITYCDAIFSHVAHTSPFKKNNFHNGQILCIVTDNKITLEPMNVVNVSIGDIELNYIKKHPTLKKVDDSLEISESYYGDILNIAIYNLNKNNLTKNNNNGKQ